MKRKVQALKNRIAAARREIPSELVLKRGRVVNVFTGGIQKCDVAVHGGTVVGLGPEYQGEEEVDAEGKWILPGLMDGHFHVESSMLLPSRLAAALLPRGTTAIVSDPHEIANVMGLEGIRFLLKESEGLPFDFFFMAPSCVPATHLETAGARLTASDLRSLRRAPRVLGLAEMMNYPGVLRGDQGVLEKLVAFQDRPKDGHAPTLTGYDLQAYVTAGIGSDHETFDREGGLEKLESGMMLMIREGTSARNLDELLPLVNPGNATRFCFVSDDLHPKDIARRGHLDFMIRKAVRLGMNPVTAIQLATLNPARYFRQADRGAVAPGYRADLVVTADLEDLTVDRVYKDGVLVVLEGELIVPLKGQETPYRAATLPVPPLTPEDFRIPADGDRARVIELIPGQIVTGALCEPVRSEGGWVTSDTESDILKLAVVERHRGSGRRGIGLIKGFGLKRGALASSVAHDSHNMIVVGVTDRELCKAVNAVREMGGGMVAVEGERVLARTPLPVAGLMSSASLEDLVRELDDLEEAAASLGCLVPEPHMVLSFLALPVIPKLKLTDMGLVDVERFERVPLFERDR